MEEECIYTFIYKTVRAYKKFEDFLQGELNEKKDFEELENEILEGYLLDKKYISYWKKFTDYENIKDDIVNRNFQSAKRIIQQQRKKNRIKQYQPDTNQCSFYSPFDLYQSVKMKGKQYALVNKDFWVLVCYEDVINENGKMNYFIDENKIIFTFDSKGKLEIETEDNILREDKEMTIRDTNYYDENIDNNDNDNEGLAITEMKKLILLYAYEQELKNKMNNLRYRERNFKEYFLISKEWITEYKKYYHYSELCQILDQKPNLRNILNKGYENAKKCIDYILAKISIIRKKQKSTFPEFLKLENTFLSEGNRVNLNEHEINYWKDFELVNEELKNLFANSEENEYDIENASSAKGLISGGKLFLDLSNDQNNEGNIAIEIGYISNNDMIFVDEYVFLYNDEEAKNNHLNFFKDRFYLFQKDELNFNMNLQCNLISEEGAICGTAFKIPPH